MITNSAAEAPGTGIGLPGMPDPRLAAGETTVVLPAYPGGEQASAARLTEDTVVYGAEPGPAQQVHDEFDQLRRDMHDAIDPELLMQPVVTEASQPVIQINETGVVEAPGTIEPGNFRKAMHMAGHVVQAATSPSNIVEVSKRTWH